MTADEADNQWDAGQMAWAENNAQNSPGDRGTQGTQIGAFHSMTEIGEQLFHFALGGGAAGAIPLAGPVSARSAVYLAGLKVTPSSFHFARMSSLEMKPSCRNNSFPAASKKI